MKHPKLILILLGLTVCMSLTACQGRTTDTVTPDGSEPQEVKLPEQKSSSETRDSLRKIVARTDSVKDNN